MPYDDTDKLTYGYQYNHAGVREQKRLFSNISFKCFFLTSNKYNILSSNYYY